MRKDFLLLLAFLSFSVFAEMPVAANKNDDPLPLPEISGRVTDEQRRPVVEAQITVTNEKGEVLTTAETDRTGSFAVKHEACVVCNVEVVPDEKSGLASAFIESIPGGITRRFVFNLQKGFHVDGRVVLQGRGVKAASVKVVSVDNEAPSKVHSGGAARTSRDGHFSVTLTPGKKHMTVSKSGDSNGRFEKDFEVLCDTTLDDINLSSVK